jgi:hypothetical protein
LHLTAKDAAYTILLHFSQELVHFGAADGVAQLHVVIVDSDVFKYFEFFVRVWVSRMLLQDHFLESFV